MEADALTGATALLGGRWKFIILWHLLAGSLRFGELCRCMPMVTPKALMRQLQDLERRGLIIREALTQPQVGVEYAISPIGRTLEPILLALEHWGQRYDAHWAEVSNGYCASGK